jgi:hypothetical protein
MVMLVSPLQGMVVIVTVAESCCYWATLLLLAGTMVGTTVGTMVGSLAAAAVAEVFSCLLSPPCRPLSPTESALQTDRRQHPPGGLTVAVAVTAIVTVSDLLSAPITTTTTKRKRTLC